MSRNIEWEELEETYSSSFLKELDNQFPLFHWGKRIYGEIRIPYSQFNQEEWHKDQYVGCNWRIVRKIQGRLVGIHRKDSDVRPTNFVKVEISEPEVLQEQIRALEEEAQLLRDKLRRRNRQIRDLRKSLTAKK